MVPELVVNPISNPREIINVLKDAAKKLDGGKGKRGISELSRRTGIVRANLYQIFRRADEKDADIHLSTLLKIAHALDIEIWFSESDN